MHLPRSVVVAAAAPTYRLVADPRRPVAYQRYVVELGAVVVRPPRDTHVVRENLGGCPADRISVGVGHHTDAVLVYLHGGGYVVGSARAYRSLAAHLAAATPAVVHSLDYRRAPEHRFPAALDDTVAAVQHLVAVDGIDPARIALVGDSAGGGLAVAAARRLVDSGVRPAALALLSPWTDPADDDLPERDFVLTRDWLAACARGYLGDGDPHDPGFAPMYGELAGLPPTLVHAGADELLRGQIARFVERARAAGVDVRFAELPGVWHSGHVLAGMLREASDAVDDVAAFLRTRLDAAEAR